MAAAGGGMLAGRVALVSGAAGGMGGAWCRMLLQDGAALALLDVDGARLAAVAATLRAEHPGATLLAVEADIADSEACAAAVARVAAELGPVDVLVNNAALGMGIIRADHLTRTVGIEEVTAGIGRIPNFVVSEVAGPNILVTMASNGRSV
jgi:NAD(P)-dependent dehydrogenase (short-subunit alcohol dehydrogenase family)